MIQGLFCETSELLLLFRKDHQNYSLTIIGLPPTPTLDLIQVSNSSMILSTNTMNVNCCPTLLKSGIALLPKAPSNENHESIELALVLIIDQPSRCEPPFLQGVHHRRYVQLQASNAKAVILDFPCVYTLHHDVLNRGHSISEEPIHLMSVDCDLGHVWQPGWTQKISPHLVFSCLVARFPRLSPGHLTPKTTLSPAEKRS